MGVEKAVFLNKLFDYYESLLTERQREVFTYYYHEDLSYQEIADILEISRAAVFDNLNRTTKLLEEYEAKLGMAQTYENLFIQLNALNNDDVNTILETFEKGRKL
ncbi:signal recognition particle [Erysipelothrix sp. HDW6C]|uniref:YlxM family DNA-binding protein n=1 Tax=Erysipelothrix sp. HDW6C TaxID=2714930 RepID=UPI00140B3601|nr:sigma factor-like helix-turn-helix DNA-binding protein [Erysipelothrix sp. HDW6C]QIK70116.1 signal recognition particle [Erysipelothrix sp. HDW6C]